MFHFMHEFLCIIMNVTDLKISGEFANRNVSLSSGTAAGRGVGRSLGYDVGLFVTWQRFCSCIRHGLEWLDLTHTHTV